MFREIIRKRLEQKNLSQIMLGKMTGIDVSTISSFLAGNRSMSNKNIEKIMGALKLTLVPVPGFKYGYGMDMSPGNASEEGEKEL